MEYAVVNIQVKSEKQNKKKSRDLGPNEVEQPKASKSKVVFKYFYNHMYAIAVTTTNDDISQITGYGSYFNTLDVERFMFYTDRPLYVLLIEKETDKFAHVRTFTNKHLIDNRKYYYYGLDHLRLRSTIPHIGNFPS